MNPQNLPTNGQATDSDGEVVLAQVLANLSDEIAVALSICVNVEEIVADRMLEGGAESSFVRTELQNMDRLIQLLTNFQNLSAGMSKIVENQQLDRQKLSEHISMADLKRRLFATEATRRKVASRSNSDVTFF